MKTLNQLGISPTPWRINDHASVLDRYCAIISGQYGQYNWHNAHLIAAAPELYAALFEMVEMYRDGGSYDYGQEVIKKAKAALAYAAGESEVKDEA